MLTSEKLCLKWNDFQENLNLIFGELTNDEEFSDVTLACEDGTQVEAHKVILATSSPFFMEVLKRNKHSHPLIFMRGVKADTLVAIIDFLYFGEANVCQENLDSFLALAEELRLKGLTGSAENKQPTCQNEEPPQKKIAPRKQDKDSIRNMDIKPPQFEKFSSEMPVALVASEDLQQLDKQVKSLMDFSENMLNNGKGRARICKVCGKEGQMADLMRHIESNHITSNVSHSCDICGKISRYGLRNYVYIRQNNTINDNLYRTRDSLRKHKTNHHQIK